MRFIVPLLMLASSALGANLLPNSSFEIGAGRGWSNPALSDQAGNPESLVGELRAGTAFHGATSMQLISRLVSRPMYLRAGTYVYTQYMKSNPASTVQINLLSSSLGDAIPGPGSTFCVLTTNWQRFTNSQTITTNGMYICKLYTVVYPSDILVDAGQVETGTVATAYAPQYPVEMSMDTADPSNILLSGDAKNFQLRFWNDGAASTTANGQYLIYDYLNRLVGSNTISEFLAPNTNKTVTIALPSARTGYMRAISRLYESNDSGDETAFAVLPYAAGSTQNTNGFLGTHSPYFPHHIIRERRSGFSFSRDSSPAASIRWVNIEPTRGNFVWNDSVVANHSTNGLVPICNFNPQTGAGGVNWPIWATNALGGADFEAYTNYIGAVVRRYSVAPYNVHYWETWNEINSAIWTASPVFMDEALMAQINTWTIDIVREIDPAAYIIALGGMANSAVALDVWNMIPSATQAKANAIAFHYYPQDAAVFADPNVAEYDVHATSAQDFFYAFRGIKPLWNTESGWWSTGGFKGRNDLHQYHYPLFGTWTPECLRSEKQQRSQIGVDQHLYAAFRSLGYGFRYINYWSKAVVDDLYNASSTGPTVLEKNGTEKPHATALLMANALQGLGMGRVTNTSTIFIDAFASTNALGSVICIWNFDRLLRNITLTNTTGIGLVDVMGNQMATNTPTFLINRTPQYLISSSLSIAQLSNSVRFASIAVTKN